MVLFEHLTDLVGKIMKKIKMEFLIITDKIHTTTTLIMLQLLYKIFHKAQ